MASHSLSFTHSPSHHQAIRLALAISTSTSNPALPPATLEVLTSELKAIFPDGISTAELKKRNETYLKENDGSPAHVRAGLRAAWELDKGSKAKGEMQLIALLKEGTSLEDVIEGLELVELWNGDVEAYKEAARKLWPRAKVLTS